MNSAWSLMGCLCVFAGAAMAAGKPLPVAPPAAAPMAACSTSRNTEANGVTYFRNCADTPEMASFRGGSFRMGDVLGNGIPYERPSHEVQIAAFALGRYEVTNEEWLACVAAGGCSPAPGAGDPTRARHPVSSVSWDQAQAYVRWLAAHTGKPYRLPSEAEWEYAARAGSPEQYTWGNLEMDACAYANTFDLAGRRANPDWNWNVGCNDGYAGTAPVGSFPPNKWGLYDMIGNVWEWVEDCWHPDYSGAPATGAAWTADGECRKRVNRGGGWGNNPRSMRVSSRDADLATATSDGLGFRVALSIQATPP